MFYLIYFINHSNLFLFNHSTLVIVTYLLFSIAFTRLWALLWIFRIVRNKMDIWSKICEFYSKISTLTDCCTMNGLNGLLYEEQTQMYDDEIWRARIHVLVFFFGILSFEYYFWTRNLTFLDIIDQYYSYRIIRTRLYINETVFLEQNARTTSENYVYITMTDILWSYDDVIFVKSNR